MQFDVRELDLAPREDRQRRRRRERHPVRRRRRSSARSRSSASIHRGRSTARRSRSARSRSARARSATRSPSAHAPRPPLRSPPSPSRAAAGSAAANIIARVTALNDVAGVVVIGLICAFFRPTDALSAWKLPHIAWLFVTLGMGGVLGILTYILVRSARNAGRRDGAPARRDRALAPA